MKQIKEIPDFIKRMNGQDYIDKTREYLDYLEEHLNNVAKAFSELTMACDGKESWVGDDYTWHMFKQEVENHDLSKFSKEEFVPYRDKFFSTEGQVLKDPGFDKAWEHHKHNNHHHHETAENFMDLVHMVIDWMAMSYKFGDNPRDFYNKTKPQMKFDKKHHDYIDFLFDCLEEYRSLKAKLVIRWQPQFGQWYLCHATSYQNAFGKEVNGFNTRGEAAEFARKQGFEIEKHEHDQLQNYL